MTKHRTFPHASRAARVGYICGWDHAPGEDPRNPSPSGDPLLFKAGIAINPFAQRVCAGALSLEEDVEHGEALALGHYWVEEVMAVGIPRTEYACELAAHYESAGNVRIPGRKRTAVHWNINTQHLPVGKRLSLDVPMRDYLLFDVACADLDIRYGRANPYDYGRARVFTGTNLPPKVREMKKTIHEGLLACVPPPAGAVTMEGREILGALLDLTGVRKLKPVTDRQGRAGILIELPDLKFPLRFIGYPYDLIHHEICKHEPDERRSRRPNPRQDLFPRGYLDRGGDSHSRIQRFLEKRLDDRAAMHRSIFGKPVVFPGGVRLERNGAGHWHAPGCLDGVARIREGDAADRGAASEGGTMDRGALPAQGGGGGVGVPHRGRSGGTSKDIDPIGRNPAEARQHGGAARGGVGVRVALAPVPRPERPLVPTGLVATRGGVEWDNGFRVRPPDDHPLTPGTRVSSNHENHSSSETTDQGSTDRQIAAQQRRTQRDRSLLTRIVRALRWRIQKILRRLADATRTIGEFAPSVIAVWQRQGRDLDHVSGQLESAAAAFVRANASVGAKIGRALGDLQRVDDKTRGFGDGQDRDELALRRAREVASAGEGEGASPRSSDRGIGARLQHTDPGLQYDERPLPELSLSAAAARRLRKVKFAVDHEASLAPCHADAARPEAKPVDVAALPPSIRSPGIELFHG